MCRMYGFRSVVRSQVHRSLVAADNALGLQSERHPDGWGVAYYVERVPHLMKSPSTALHDHLFRRLSGIVASDTMIAHVRKATVGERSVLNCHPFQYGRWVFAHNGDVPRFEDVRKMLMGEIAPSLRSYVLGETDSEVVFFLFLSALLGSSPLSEEVSAEDVITALRIATDRVREVCAMRPTEKKPTLTLMTTNGTTFAAIHGGRELRFSTYKTRCADRERCTAFSPACEAPTETGFVNHLVVSSEPIGDENVWIPLEPDEAIAVDARMMIVRERG